MIERNIIGLQPQEHLTVVLVGYPGSQKIVRASRFLTEKYLPQSVFRIIYLNYTGVISGWAQWVKIFLEYFQDDQIVFALDDYLLADYIDIAAFCKASLELANTKDKYVVCVKLCDSTPEEHLEYPSTTQYTIWKRKYLIELLDKVNTPWEFEIDGSTIMKRQGARCEHRPCLRYFTNSSISSRWEGIRLDGLKEEDAEYIKRYLLPEQGKMPHLYLSNITTII